MSRPLSLPGSAVIDGHSLDPLTYLGFEICDFLILSFLLYLPVGVHL